MEETQISKSFVNLPKKGFFSEKNSRETNRQDGNYLKLVQAVYRKHCSEPLFFSTGATTHCGFVFCSPLAGYSLLAYEVS
jgi:hypothetical protein